LPGNPKETDHARCDAGMNEKPCEYRRHGPFGFDVTVPTTARMTTGWAARTTSSPTGATMQVEEAAPGERLMARTLRMCPGKRPVAGVCFVTPHRIRPGWR
jgi:hypothetical protein